MAVAQVTELCRKRIDRNNFDGARRELQRVIGEQRPSANHRPAGNFGMRLHHLLYLGRSILRSLFVIVSIQNLDVRILLGFLSRALHAFLQVRRVLVSSENGNDAFVVHHFRQFRHRLMTAIDVVGTENGKAFALRSV